MANLIKTASTVILAAALALTAGCFSTKTLTAPDANAEPLEALHGEASPDEGATSASVSADAGDAGDEEEAAASPDSGEESGDAGKSKSRIQSALDVALDLTETAREYWTSGDVEKSLDSLDEAYGIIVGVDCGGDPEMVRQKDDMRYLISRRILEIYASRFRSVKGPHKAIPLTMNRHVEREIELFKGRERSFFLDAYRRSGKFRGEIVTALKEAGLPEELSWLPLVESGFKVNALSRARALGLWQFIPSTGYKYGLKRTTWIDERMDPEKSTAAAIGYLKELHAIFGDWATVLAAYNCGEGTVLRAIRRQKINYLDNFWDLYDRLPAETARYYPRFLAVLAILRDPARYGFALEPGSEAAEFDVVTVQKQLHLKTIAQKLSVPVEALTGLNPELRRSVTPASGYALKVPAGMGRIVLAGIEAWPAWSAPKRAYIVHRVRRGENLSMLALRYRTSIRAIARLNRIRGNVIRVGQRLKIPMNRT